MVTLHILKWLEDNGFGTLDIDGSVKADGLYFEKLTEGKTGVAIFSRGAPLGRGLRTSLAFDLYSRGTDDVEGLKKLENILSFMTDSFAEACTLPAVPDVSETIYNRVTVVPISNIENAGLDPNDRVIYTATAQVTYEQLNNEES